MYASFCREELFPVLEKHLVEAYGAPARLSSRLALHDGPHSVVSYLESALEDHAGGDLFLLHVFQWLTGARVTVMSDWKKLLCLQSLHTESLRRSEDGTTAPGVDGVLFWTGHHFLSAGKSLVFEWGGAFYKSTVGNCLRSIGCEVPGRVRILVKTLFRLFLGTVRLLFSGFQFRRSCAPWRVG